MGGIYVASRASNPARSAMWRALRIAGVPIVSTWIDEAGPGESKSLEDLWVRIHREIEQASVLLLYAEQADFPLKGALIEAGIAIGSNKDVVCAMPGVSLERPSLRPLGSWVMHPLVQFFADPDEALSQALAMCTGLAR